MKKGNGRFSTFEQTERQETKKTKTLKITKQDAIFYKLHTQIS